MRLIDLRSDTVTRPTPAMRQAMAAADVGDDVYGEDPTVRALEEAAAERLEREAALFVPTGTMGNQIAVHLLSYPGSEAILEARSHIYNYELGSMAALSGVLARPMVTHDGLLRPDMIEAAIHPRGGHLTPTSILCLENTLNLWSGLPMDAATTQTLIAVARRHGLRVHLDGARIFNAAAATGESPAELARGCDTVMFCLSKGLAAPVGSLLVGDRDLIAEARRVRKMLGGGMRQVGVLAAAGLVALRDMVDRLHEDHARARRLAFGLAELRGVTLDPARVRTNIVIFRVSSDVSGPKEATPAQRVVHGLLERGVLAGSMGPFEVRMVTHYEIGDEDIEATLVAARDVLG